MKNIISLICLLSLILVFPLRATPAAATATQGQSVTISVTADGTAPFTYQWTKNGTNIPSGITASLVFSPVAVPDAGTYAVTVSNPAGSTVSDNAVLTVNPLQIPTFGTQPAPVTANLGKTAIFTIVANGTPAPTLQWLKNGLPIQGATAATYSIQAVAAADAGIYACQATNTAGTAVSVGVALTVISPPVINGPFIKTTSGTSAALNLKPPGQ